MPVKGGAQKEDNLMYPFLIAGLVVVIDQITKALALSYLKDGQSIPIINKIFYLTLVQNTGAAFGLFKNQTAFFVVISIIAIISIAFFLRKNKTALNFPLALILGGAMGNLIDRLRCSHTVVDFLDFRVWPVFNFADSCISVGTFLLFLLIIRGRKA